MENNYLIFVGKGLIFALVDSRLPEKGTIYNLQSGAASLPYHGKYEVTKVNENFAWGTVTGPQVMVNRIGEIDPSMQTHQLSLLSI